jgi:hypothetical protein
MPLALRRARQPKRAKGAISSTYSQPILTDVATEAPNSACAARKYGTKSHRLLAGVATGIHERLAGPEERQKGQRVVQSLTVSLPVSPPVPTSACAA